MRNAAPTDTPPKRKLTFPLRKLGLSPAQVPVRSCKSPGAVHLRALIYNFVAVVTCLEFSTQKVDGIGPLQLGMGRGSRALRTASAPSGFNKQGWLLAGRLRCPALVGSGA